MGLRARVELSYKEHIKQFFFREYSVLTKIIYLVIFAGIAANFFKFQF